jgi:cell pole-organizing protein PopZ
VRESGEVIDLQGERSNDALHDGPDQDGADDDLRVEVAPSERAPEEERARAGWDQVQRGAGSRDHIQRKDQVVPSEHGRTAELMSAATASVAGGAFAKLSQALQRTPEEESVAESSGRTVEQFVEDIARPMLKEWLDQNLPGIVERLVQREIQKISRRAELI